VTDVDGVTALFGLAAVIAVPLAIRVSDGWTGAAEQAMWFARNLAPPAAVVLVLTLLAEPRPMAAVLALPWLICAIAAFGAAAHRWIIDPDRWRPEPEHAEAIGLGFWLAGSVVLVLDRLGVEPFGFDPSVIRLTAVHFHLAGLVLVTTGTMAWRRAPTRWLAAAVAAVIAGIPTTAIGIVGLRPVEWMGAVLVAGGGIGIAAGQLRVAVRWADDTPLAARALIATSALALLASMPLALAYATANLLGAGAVFLEPMMAIHGSLNVIGFAAPATIGWWAVRRREAATPRPERRARRLDQLGALLAMGYAVVVGVIAATQGNPEPPTPVPSWAVIAALLAVPGAVGLVAAARGSGPLLLVAGFLCLLQSFVAMSGVTLGFVVPAVVMLGAAGGSAQRVRPADIAIGVSVVAGWFGAWASRLGLTEERCFPIPGGTSCWSAVPTSFGVAVTLAMVLLTIGVAALTPDRRREVAP
jgi:hypothetical protein